jgi:hypothetical protein
MSIVSQSGNTRNYGRHKEALDLLSSGRPMDAIKILVELTQADPTNHFVCIDMGYALVKMGMFDKAVIAARQAIELDSNSIEAFILLATAHTSGGDYKDANVALFRTIDLLRNPFREEEEFLKLNCPKPLVIADQSAVFIDFSIEGDANNLSLKSVTQDRKSEHILKIAISGAVSLICDTGYEQTGKGEIDKKRLLQCLPPEQAAVVNIFPYNKFGYVLFKKIDK